MNTVHKVYVTPDPKSSTQERLYSLRRAMKTVHKVFPEEYGKRTHVHEMLEVRLVLEEYFRLWREIPETGGDEPGTLT
jgi:hypothetical protein